MSLIYCPECGHEISNAAVACPNCGRPIAAPPLVEKKVVISAPPREDGGFPTWGFIPLALIGAVLLTVFFFAISREDDDANSNLSVNVSTRRPASDTRETTSSRIEPETVTVPPSADTQTVTVPGSQTGVSIPPATKGSVVIDAKIATQSGSPQAVRNERFYLLDKDLESILSEADVEPIEGQSLTNSFGLSVLYPDRYGDFNRDAMRAIKGHIKYAGTTDSAGKAELGGIEPDSYYLFGITKTGRGFALWNSPVSINAGNNVLNLAPQRLTELALS